jgi:calcineurin-like phosphoesterase family protein
MVYSRHVVVHFSHTNIVRGCSRWGDKSGCRDFDDVWYHNKTLLDNINKVVGEKDKLYFLGDFSFDGHINIKKYRDLINCRDIEFIVGNHDNNLVKHKEYHELFTTILQRKTVTIEDYNILLNHRPVVDWDRGREKDSKYIHLYGHCHGNYQESGRSMDVGVDAHLEFRPFSFDEIKLFMQER